MLRVLMTLDAVGGVWSYVRDTAATLAAGGMTCRLLGFGPPPARAPSLPAGVDMIWTDQPLEWMVDDQAALDGVGPVIATEARTWHADIVHVSAPAQAAGLPERWVVVAQSHSCVPTWWAAVRGGDLPRQWGWQIARNQAGLRRADSVIVPSVSHGRALRDCYGKIPHLRVLRNGSLGAVGVPAKQACVFAAGRWWDEGKNGRVLDAAASEARWPILMAGGLVGPNRMRLDLRHATALGQLPGAETRAHMARAAIFAAPSRYEPFGLAVLEAASAGACLLLADIPTFRELWEGAAIFVDPNDPAAWRDAIDALADNPPRRAALGQKARIHAATFTLDKHCSGLRGAYDAALHRQSNRIGALV